MQFLKSELGFLFSGKGMPYEKVSLMVVTCVVLLFSAIFSNNYIKDGNIAVIDLDNSRFSHELIEAINTSPYMKVRAVFNTPADPAKLMYQDRYLAVVYIPAGVEKNVYGTAGSNIGVFYDNINAAQSSGVKGALNTIIAVQNQKIGQPQMQALGLSGDQAAAMMSSINLKERLLFNPTGSASNATNLGFVFFFASMFFVFATIGMVPRLRMTGQWQRQLAEGSAFDLLLRLVPYIIGLSVSIVFGLGLLRVVGDLRFAGSLGALLLSLVLFTLALGCMSLLFGWNAPDPGRAASRMILFIPGGFILGGPTGPIDILPAWVKVVFNFFPLVWEYRFVRDIILRGAPIGEIVQEFGGLMMYAGILMALVCWRFSREQRRLQLARQEETAEEAAA